VIGIVERVIIISSDEIHIGLEEVAFHLAPRIVSPIWAKFRLVGKSLIKLMAYFQTYLAFRM